MTQINPNFARTPLQASERIRSREKQNKDRKQQTKPPVAKSETREAARRPSTGQAGCKSKLPESVLPQDNQRTICRAAISYLKQETICAEPIILPPTNLNRQQAYTLTLGQDKDLRAAYSRLEHIQNHPPQNAYYKKERFLSTGHPLHLTLYSLSRHIIYI